MDSYIIARILAGEDINQCNSGSWTALIQAVVHGSVDLVEFLVKAGVNVNQMDCVGRRAIDLSRNERIIEILMKN